MWERVVPCHEQMQNMSSNVVTGKAMYSVLFSEAHRQCRCSQNFLGDLYSAVTGMEDSAWRSFLPLPHLSSAAAFTRISHQLFTGFRCVEGKPQHMNYILLTGEAQFHHDGITNTSGKFSRMTIHMKHCKVTFNRLSVNVWCGAVGRHRYGPHFNEGRLTAACYGHFLDDKLRLHLENDPLKPRRQTWIKLDGGTSMFRQRDYRALQRKLSRKVNMTRWTSCMAN